MTRRTSDRLRSSSPFEQGASDRKAHSIRMRQARGNRACRPSSARKPLVRSVAVRLLVLPSIAIAAITVHTAGNPELPEVNDETARAELALMEQVAELRRSEELPPLERDFALGAVARDYSRSMATAHEVRHSLLSHLRERIRRVAPETCVFGENLARQVDVEKVLPEWLESEAHHRNLLHADFDRSGIGIVRSDDGFLYVTHLFAGSCRALASRAERRQTARAERSPNGGAEALLPS